MQMFLPKEVYCYLYHLYLSLIYVSTAVAVYLQLFQLYYFLKIFVCNLIIIMARFWVSQIHIPDTYPKALYTHMVGLLRVAES